MFFIYVFAKVEEEWCTKRLQLCVKIRLVNCANDRRGGGGTSYIMIAFLERSRGIEIEAH